MIKQPRKHAPIWRGYVHTWVPAKVQEITMTGPRSRWGLILALYVSRNKMRTPDEKAVIEIPDDIREECGLTQRTIKQGIKWAAEHNLITAVEQGKGLLPQVSINDDETCWK